MFQDNSTMLIEAAKGGHTTVVQMLIDYPNSLVAGPPALELDTPPCGPGDPETRVPPPGGEVVAAAPPTKMTSLRNGARKGVATTSSAPLQFQGGGGGGPKGVSDSGYDILEGSAGKQTETGSIPVISKVVLFHLH